MGAGFAGVGMGIADADLQPAVATGRAGLAVARRGGRQAGSSFADGCDAAQVKARLRRDMHELLLIIAVKTYARLTTVLCVEGNASGPIK